MGAQLSLSEKTVSTYKHRLKIKLNITSLVELIDFARRYHLL
ncbi:LuxR C-terminal-related transcriptional regulator [Pantoea sp. Taur]|nr:response regulator transcription factor [Pantoea sp. Taur]